jgi:uncharacterized protein
VVKFLLFVAVLAVVFWLLRASNSRGKPPSPERKSEAMARCAHCGVHFPGAESVAGDGLDYCCEEHRRLGAGS